jgi:hypothetical protein
MWLRNRAPFVCGFSQGHVWSSTSTLTRSNYWALAWCGWGWVLRGRRGRSALIGFTSTSLEGHPARAGEIVRVLVCFEAQLGCVEVDRGVDVVDDSGRWEVVAPADEREALVSRARC